MNPPDLVAVGTHIEIELIDIQGDHEILTFDLVSVEAADFDQGRLGENTPLAQAILGHPAGSLLPYHRDDIVSIRVLRIDPAQSSDNPDALAQRQTKLRQALAAIERTNAAVFASSFSGKWGDYDPSGIDRWEDPGDEDS